MKKGWRLLERELGDQILPDAVYYERSPACHRQVLADFLECYRALKPGMEREKPGGFLCHPDNVVFLKDNLCYIVAGKVEVKMKISRGAAIEVRETWYMPNFVLCLPSRQIVVTYGRAPCSGGATFEISASE